jgi:hypothetical protein
MAAKKAATGKSKYVANWQVEGFPTKEGLKTGDKFEAEPSDSLQYLLDAGAVSPIDAAASDAAPAAS